MTRTSAEPRSPWPWRIAVAAALVVLVAAVAVVQTRAWARAELPSDQAVAALAGTQNGYLLVRGGAFDGQNDTRAPDRIVADPSQAGLERTVFSADRIQQFVADAGRLAIVTLDAAGEATLIVLEPDTGREVAVPLPAAGVVDGLAIGQDAVVATFTATGADAGESRAGRLLAWRVPDTGNSAVQIIGAQEGVAGDAASDARWGDEAAVTADGRYAVLRRFDGTLLRVDLTGVEPDLPLGAFADMQSLTADGRLVVADAAGVLSMIDVATGDRQRLAAAVPADLASSARLQQLSAADWGGAAVYDTGAGLSVQALTADGATAIADVDQVSSRLVSVCAAPDAHLVAVTTTGASARDDGYPRASATDQTRTAVYDADNGAEVTDIAAWSIGWCQRYQQVTAG